MKHNDGAGTMAALGIPMAEGEADGAKGQHGDVRCNDDLAEGGLDLDQSEHMDFEEWRPCLVVGRIAREEAVDGRRRTV